MSARSVPRRVSGLWLLALAGCWVSGCSTAQIDSIPHDLGGLPAGAPARPAAAPGYPAVNVMPPPRSAALLDAEQQKRLEAELIATRNRQPNQQKNIAREKARAEAEAKAKARKDRHKPKQAGTTVRPGAAGAPPWPLPPQTTGGSARP